MQTTAPAGMRELSVWVARSPGTPVHGDAEPSQWAWRSSGSVGSTLVTGSTVWGCSQVNTHSRSQRDAPSAVVIHRVTNPVLLRALQLLQPRPAGGQRLLGGADGLGIAGGPRGHEFALERGDRVLQLRRGALDPRLRLRVGTPPLLVLDVLDRLLDGAHPALDLRHFRPGEPARGVPAVLQRPQGGPRGLDVSDGNQGLGFREEDELCREVLGELRVHHFVLGVARVEEALLRGPETLPQCVVLVAAGPARRPPLCHEVAVFARGSSPFGGRGHRLGTHHDVLLDLLGGVLGGVEVREVLAAVAVEGGARLGEPLPQFVLARLVDAGAVLLGGLPDVKQPAEFLARRLPLGRRRILSRHRLGGGHDLLTRGEGLGLGHLPLRLELAAAVERALLRERESLAEALQVANSLRLDQLLPQRLQGLVDLQTLKSLREQLVQPQAVGDLEGLRQRLALAEERALDRRSELQAEREVAKTEAFAAREEVVAAAEAIAAQDPAATQWKSSSEELRRLLDVWKSAQQNGPRIDKPREDELWKRFSKARTTFDRHRRQYFADLDAAQDTAKKVKEDIVVRAEAMASSTEWGRTAGEYRDLMTEWRAAGRARRNEDDALWERFRAAQQRFFDSRDSQNKMVDAEFSQNLAAKLVILTEAEALVPVRNVKAARAALRTLQDRWDAAGRVPRAEVPKVEGRMRAVEKAIKDVEDQEWRHSLSLIH